MKSLLGDNPMNAVLLGGCSMVATGLCVGFVSKDVDTVSAAEPAAKQDRRSPSGLELLLARDYG
ncbi:MAG: hypothetical protein WCQ21_13615 [Verrucomicrobiota bacterium]|jgi:hypothetical protein